MSDYDLNGWNNDDMPTKQKKTKFKRKDPVQEALDSGRPNPFKTGSREWKRFNDMSEDY